MEVLAYLLAGPSDPPDTDSHRVTRIIRGSIETDEGDREHLQIFSDILLNLKPEETFKALQESLPFDWHDGEHYDIVNPFGDDPWQTQYHSLWTFDTQEDYLYHTNCEHRSRISLSLLRDRAVSIADMEMLGGPFPDPLSLQLEFGPEESYWEPKIDIDERLRAFLHRLFCDFHRQWRHVLRNYYNFTTLRILAKAILRMSTLDFEVRENTGGHGGGGAYVWITQLPSWEPFETGVQSAGSVHIVLCEEIREGLLVAKRHLLSQEFSATKTQKASNDATSKADYIILSVKHIMLCRITGSTSLKNTAPEPLYNGDYGSGAPSALALDYLIWANASVRPLIVTPIQSLPVEVQDMILDSVSIGTVESAKLGCLLGVGTTFSWVDGPFNVSLEERQRIRPSGSPVQSRIWFGEHMSGIVYLAKSRNRLGE